MINFSIYFFGNSPAGYFQFPLDSLHCRLQSLSSHFDAESQIATYREQNLMYYAYMRRVTARDSYFGICLLINGMATYNFSSLFRMFESIIQDLAIEGKTLAITKDGTLEIVKPTSMSLRNEQNRISEILKHMISEGEKYFEEMPPINYASSTDDWHAVSVNDSEDKIRSTIEDNNTVYVIKNRGLCSPAFNGLALRIEQLNEELELQKTLTANLEKKLLQYKNNYTFAQIGKILTLLFATSALAVIYMIKNQLIQLNF